MTYKSPAVETAVRRFVDGHVLNVGPMPTAEQVVQALERHFPGAETLLAEAAVFWTNPSATGAEQRVRLKRLARLRTGDTPEAIFRDACVTGTDEWMAETLGELEASMGRRAAVQCFERIVLTDAGRAALAGGR